MRVQNQKIIPLSKNIIKTLTRLRKERKFNLQTYVEVKSHMLNNYLRTHNLSSVVVAVSGGIDSAVTLALAKKASEEPNSPIKKIIPVCLPVFSDGATNQSEATKKGEELIRSFGLEPFIIDVSPIFSSIKFQVDQNLKIKGEPWAQGQLVSYSRTPTLYYITALLAESGTPGVLLGTINKDEGGFIGYFGKAGDSLVDVQMISDIHKSEVFSLGNFLNIPESILNSIPTGDMYDGRTDEEVFGCSYDFIELYNLLLECPDHYRNDLKSKWNSLDLDVFKSHEENILKLHNYNKHKYIGASVSVHLDVIKTLHSTWKNNTNIKNKLFPKKAVNLIPSPDLKLQETDPKIKLKKDNIFLISNIISESDCISLKKEIKKHPALQAGYNGYINKNENGSKRRSFYDEEFSKELFFKIRGLLPLVFKKEELDEEASSSIYWEAIGLNPLIRSIEYEKDGLLVPHYDAPVDFTHSKTLMSVVIYLDKTSSGKTRFIKGPKDLEYKDWNRTPNLDEIDLEIMADAGDVLIFPHRLLHDSDKVIDSKHILRTDIIFEDRSGRIK